jgi:hypothetical protein
MGLWLPIRKIQADRAFLPGPVAKFKIPQGLLDPDFQQINLCRMPTQMWVANLSETSGLVSDTGMGQIPSNIDHQEGQHRVDTGAPRAWASPAR